MQTWHATAAARALIGGFPRSPALPPIEPEPRPSIYTGFERHSPQWSCRRTDGSVSVEIHCAVDHDYGNLRTRATSSRNLALVTNHSRPALLVTIRLGSAASRSRWKSPFLFAVAALNASISRWRKRRREVPLREPGKVVDLAARQAGTDSPLDPRVMAALTRLPARQRQVVTLRLLLDLDTGHTAEVLGISPSAVKAHLARAIATLRSDLIHVREQEKSS